MISLDALPLKCLYDTYEQPPTSLIKRHLVIDVVNLGGTRGSG